MPSNPTVALKVRSTKPIATAPAEALTEASGKVTAVALAVLALAKAKQPHLTVPSLT